jgi:hypothetical protein
MMRGSFEGLPLPARKRPAKTRRRYDFALSVPGAEMRLPALPQVRIGWRIVSGILAAVLLTVLYQLWNSPGYRVAEAQVSGLQRITSAEVNAALGIEDEPIFTLNASELERKLQALQSFQSNVDVALQNKVAVTVEEPADPHLAAGRTHSRRQWFRFHSGIGPERLSMTVQATGERSEPDLAAVTNGLGDTAGTTEDAAGVRTPLCVDMISAVSMSSQAPAGAVWSMMLSTG